LGIIHQAEGVRDLELRIVGFFISKPLAARHNHRRATVDNFVLYDQGCRESQSSVFFDGFIFAWVKHPMQC